MLTLKKNEVDMPILEGEEAKLFAENIRLRNLQRSQEILQQRKEEARGTGKEPFDLEKLFLLVDASAYVDAKTFEEQKEKLEYRYYVEQTDLMTIKDFAEHILEMYKWRD
jgi:hypothetical protein